MSALLIKTSKENNTMHTELAKKLGSNVIALKGKQFEDVMLGSVMDKVKTGKSVTKSNVLKKLRAK